MAISCLPGDLNNASIALQKLTLLEQLAAQTYLLLQKSGLSLTPAQLQAASNCFGCYSEKQLLAMMVYLDCQIANNGGGGGSCVNLSGAGSPVGVVTPAFTGQDYKDTTSGLIYRSSGTTSSSWATISEGLVWSGGTSGVTRLPELQSPWFNTDRTGDSPIVNLPDLVSTTGEGFNGDINFGYGINQLSQFNAPKLTSIFGGFLFGNCGIISFSVPLLASVGASVDLTNNGNLTTISFPSLAIINGGGNFDCASSILLTSASIPSLVTVFGGNIQMNDCPSLKTVAFATGMWANNYAIDISNCALPQAQVDAILHAARINGMTGGNLFLTGGTTSAPSAAGLIDKTALLASGVNVTTN